jgi:hypothetical protein
VPAGRHLIVATAGSGEHADAPLTVQGRELPFAIVIVVVIAGAGVAAAVGTTALLRRRRRGAAGR